MFHTENLQKPIKSCETLNSWLIGKLQPSNMENFLFITIAPYRSGLNRATFDRQLLEIKKRFDRQTRHISNFYCFYETTLDCLHSHILLENQTLIDEKTKVILQKHFINVFQIPLTDTKSLEIKPIDRTPEQLISYITKDIDRNFDNSFFI
jgi:hypothetical protein